MVIAQWRGIGDREEGIGKMRNEHVPLKAEFGDMMRVGIYG